MKRVGIILGIFFAVLVGPAHAADTNPFSGARSITVGMTREGPVNRTAYRRPLVNATAYKAPKAKAR
jgi:hypothetical protein